LNFGQGGSKIQNTSNAPITSNNKQDEFSIDDLSDTSSSKINLGSVVDKKNFTGDRNFMINDKKDYTGVKPKIDTGIKINKSQVVSTTSETANDELSKKYEQIQKEKQDKLKDYRDLLLKMKKDKRSVEKEKEKDENQLEINDDQLSDEVKKRLQMRKQLADRLKK
jgi:hypothetical protein